MLHPATTIKPVSRHIGLGVFATEFIPRGTIVYVKDQLEIEIHANDARLSDPVMRVIIERYSYTEPTGTRILSWDLAKYVNHSCDPNTISTGYGFEIAIRDIQPGEQITDDYGLLNIENPMKCSCKSANCRKLVRPDDLEHFASHWDKTVIAALKPAQSVEQPLFAFLDPVVIKAIENYYTDSREYQSVSCLRFRAAADTDNGNPLHGIIPAIATTGRL